jgi:periplasmic divalent cation tolerance protein
MRGYCILARKRWAHKIRKTAVARVKAIMTDKIVVLVTCGSAKEARRIARALVEQRLAACVNILQAPVQSVYRWKGRVESAKEVLLVIKSARERFVALQRAVRSLHSYDVPEIIALPIAAGSRDYLTWISDSVRPREQ